MVSARVILASSAALALVAGGGFVYEVFVSPSVPSYGGYKGCMSTDAGDEFLFGVAEIENVGAQDIVLLGIEAQRVRGVEIIDITVPANKGIGILDASESVFEEYKLGPVAGTVIAAGDSVEFVAQVKSTEPFGYATEFEVAYKNAYGVRLTSMLTNVVGFSPVGSARSCGP
jgi:hypothetical protein